MSSTKKTLYIIAVGCLIFMFTFWGLFLENHLDVCLFMGVLFMTAAFHIIVRLVAGTFCDGAMENGIDTENHWFADSSIEQSLYRAIGVKRWKNKIPAPDAWRFSIKKRSLEDVIAETCRIELVHEVGIAMSLLSILLTIQFGYLWFFILTAALGVLFDLGFIIVQRYNRPRLVRTAAEKRILFFEKLEYDNAFEEEGGANGEADPRANNESAENAADKAVKEDEE